VAAAGSAWATVFEWELSFDVVLHFEMPLLTAGARETDNPAAIARRAAGLRDLYRCNYEYIARQLSSGASRAAQPDALAAKRRVREGRDALHVAGILPWAAFTPAGRLPKRWWRDVAFLTALAEWRRQGPLTVPTPSLGNAARDLLSAAWRAERDLLAFAPTLIRRAVPRR